MSFNSIGDASSYSNEVSCTTSILKGPPSSLTVTPLSANEIELGWTYAGSASYSTIMKENRRRQYLGNGNHTAGRLYKLQRYGPSSQHPVFLQSKDKSASRVTPGLILKKLTTPVYILI